MAVPFMGIETFVCCNESSTCQPPGFAAVLRNKDPDALALLPPPLTFLVAGPILFHSFVCIRWNSIRFKRNSLAMLRVILRAGVVQVRPQAMQGELVPAHEQNPSSCCH